jgi:ubiquinone/menaquinone biosynthesis C-methylase UbiE
MIRRALLLLAFLAVPAFAQGYTTKPASPDGIGKVYMGREIAHVMGHQAADWLERPERDQEEGTSKLVPLLGIKPGDVLADIGAGTGYFSFRMAKLAAQGKVYAVDIQQEMLDIIEDRKAHGEPTNVVTVLGTIADPKLPANAVDLILLVDAYHEFSEPKEMGEGMVRGLKSGGRIALVEYRAEDSRVPIKTLHKMSEAQARREMAALGLRWVKTDASLPWQHVMFFEKP